MNTTTIILQGEQAKQWVMLQYLSSIGAFDIKFGRLTIDFDGNGAISNTKIEKNYRL